MRDVLGRYPSAPRPRFHRYCRGGCTSGGVAARGRRGGPRGRRAGTPSRTRRRDPAASFGRVGGSGLPQRGVGAMTDVSSDVRELASREYQYGFVTDVETDVAPRGLNEDVIRLISAKKNEPDWLLEWRLRSYRHWLTLEEPHWQNVRYGPIDYQDIIYYAAPKPKKELASLDEVDPELRAMFD